MVNDLDHSSIGVDSSVKAIMVFCSNKQRFAPLHLSPGTFRLIQCKWLLEWTSNRSRESDNSNRCFLPLNPFAPGDFAEKHVLNLVEKWSTRWFVADNFFFFYRLFHDALRTAAQPPGQKTTPVRLSRML